MSTVNVLSSSLDVQSIVDTLVNAASAPLDTMESQITTFQSKVTAYQTLNTKLSALLTKVNSVMYGGDTAPLNPFYSYTERFADSIFAQGMVTSTDESIISATTDKIAAEGTYDITVSSLARAQSEASANFADTTSEMGTGTIQLTVGSNDPVTITIDDSNNTLSGIRNAINNSNAGVTATIINDGSANPYRLLITSNNTGTANAFAVTENLSGGPTLSMSTGLQPATDAVFNVNGISITKSSNTVSDVIDGVTFSLKAESVTPVNLSVETDTDAIVSAINDMVTAYNDVNSYISNQFAFNSTTKKAGLLAGDWTLRNIQNQLQDGIVGSSSNSLTRYTIASQVGIKFNSNGSLTLDESKLRSAISSNFTEVAAFFLGNGTPPGGATVTDSRVTYNGKTATTQAGTYAIQINSLAEKASAVGTQTVTSLAQDETLTIISGAGTAVINLLQNDTLATILSKINAGLVAQGMAVTATDDGTGRIQIATSNYGSSQNISVSSSIDNPPGGTGFGTTATVDTGVDIAGTIGGNTAVGSGLTLTGASGQPEEGLILSISQTTTGSYGSVTIASDSKGDLGTSLLVNLQSALKGITDPLTGPIHNSTDSLNKNISILNDRISEFEDRLEVQREMWTLQYQKADEALRLMSVTLSSLSNLTSSLSSS